MYTCHYCGESLHISNACATKTHDKLWLVFHYDCIKKICRSTPFEKYRPYDRMVRVLNRLSRDKIVPPVHIQKLHRTFYLIYGRKSPEFPKTYLTGVYKGSPICETYYFHVLNGWVLFWRMIYE